MNLRTDADTHSPWYEAFTSQAAPAAGLLAAADDTFAAADPQPETDWATDALFDYYNE